jgi:hypothetical protein
MPPKKTNTKSLKNGINQRKVFRDLLYEDASADPLPIVMPVTPNANGFFTNLLVLSPLGVNALSISEQEPNTFGTVEIHHPHLRLLRDFALNFYECRILSASIVFISSQGSQAPGLLRVFSTVNPSSDCQQESGTGTGICSLSRTTEWKFPLIVDPSWKKCSESQLVISGDGNTLVTINYTVLDVVFSTLRITCTNAGPAQSTGKYYIDLDAEFRYPKL